MNKFLWNSAFPQEGKLLAEFGRWKDCALAYNVRGEKLPSTSRTELDDAVVVELMLDGDREGGCVRLSDVVQKRSVG